MFLFLMKTNRIFVAFSVVGKDRNVFKQDYKRRQGFIGDFFKVE